jgi:hypothetical protein
MSGLEALLTLYGITPVMEFVISKTPKCQVLGCLVQQIRKCFKSENSDFDLQSLNKTLSNHYPNASFYEFLSGILYEFHDHIVNHLGLTEDLCLYHKYFSAGIINTCGCEKIKCLFPVIYSDALPDIQKIDKDDSRVYSIFSKIFDYNKGARCDCDFKRELSISKLPEYLVLAIKHRSPPDILNLLSSIPALFDINNYIHVADESLLQRYYLSGYILSSQNAIAYFYPLPGTEQWLFKSITLESRSSYIAGLEEIIKTSWTPVGVTYTLTPLKLNIELAYFLHLEKLSAPIILDKSYTEALDSLNINPDNAWMCSACNIKVNSYVCSCGNPRNKIKWVCKCSLVVFESVCKCGFKKPVCCMCRKSFDLYENDCKKCGGDTNFGEKCEICGFNPENICIHCLNSMIICEICKSPNNPNFLACIRCMNPSMKLFGYS